MDESQWIQYFPHQNPRKEQIEAINSILSAFDEGKRYFALEAGTGVGKSAIAITVARALASKQPIEGYEKGGLFVTTQKLLQDQYEKDFSAIQMKSIKSSTNYTCKYKNTSTCAEGLAMLKAEPQGTKFWNACTYNCTYRKAKQSFMDAELSVTNFPYILTECNYSKKIQPKQLLVIDEAHNIETELSKFIEISINEKFTKKTLKLNFPPHITHKKVVEWVQKVYYPKLVAHVKHVEKTLAQHGMSKEKLYQFVSLQRQVQMLTSHRHRIKDFLRFHTEENWVFDLSESENGSRKLVFKPIDVSQFSHQYLFKMGYYVLCMSATLIQVDNFVDITGLEKEKTSSLVIPSPFPTGNRPILFVPMGKMTAKEIDRSLPILANAVRKILKEHQGEKGIIHTHSYKISRYLQNNIKSSRLLFSTPDNRDEILKKHIASKKPTVLISPSMTEGVDLEGDASRFQIICKVPYPYLGDKLVKKRMNKWKWWYPFQTVKTVIQSIGRSVRSKDDKAITYILDANWEYFYRLNHRLFPKDFRDCLR